MARPEVISYGKFQVGVSILEAWPDAGSAAVAAEAEFMIITHCPNMVVVRLLVCLASHLP